MPRVTYASRVTLSQVRADDDDDWYDDPTDMNGVNQHLTVVCQEPGWVSTGLLDVSGIPIMKFIQNNPIGYIWHDQD